MIYYVSSSDGNDSNNGLSPLTPFKTLKKITDMIIKKGDKVLLKCNDLWNETLTINNEDDFNNEHILVSSYGVGEMPTLSSFKTTKNKEWDVYSDGIYRINLKNLDGFETDYINVGFLLDKETEEIYYNRVRNISDIKENMDFYADETYLYLKCETNPCDKFKELYIILRSNLITAKHNIVISGLKLENTGGHGITGLTKNCIVENCYINNCGGSVLFPEAFTRFGNGIEIASSKNILIKNNKISNCYDVGFTIQGENIVNENTVVEGNIFSYNSQSLEIWTLGDSNADLGIKNFHFKNNISIGSGRGWGSKARPDKHSNCELLFHGLVLKNLDVNIKDNIFINPYSLYYINREIEEGTTLGNFINKIKSLNNKVYMTFDTKIINDEEYDISNTTELIRKYNKEFNTSFNALNSESEIESVLNQLLFGSNISIDLLLKKGLSTQINNCNNIYQSIFFPVTETSEDKYYKFIEYEIDREYSRIDTTLLYSLNGDQTYNDIGLLSVKISNKTLTDCKVDIYCPNEDGFVNNKSFIGVVNYQNNIIKVRIYYNVATKIYTEMSLKVLKLNYNYMKNCVVGIDNDYLNSIDNCCMTRFKEKFVLTTTSYNDNTGKYTKICEINIKNEYVSSIAKITYNDCDNDFIIKGDLYIKAKVDSMSSPVNVKLLLNNTIGGQITKDNFIAVITNDLNTNKRIEVYYKPTYNYSVLLLNVEHNSKKYYKELTMYEKNGFISDLPVGKIINCE